MFGKPTVMPWSGPDRDKGDAPPIFMEDEFTSPLSAAIAERDKSTLKIVQDALQRKQVVLAYQPVMQSMQAERPAFYEGLLRVLDPTGRVIPAREFIHAADASELGRRLDCLSLELGLDALAEHPQFRLSINMSARSIGFPQWRQTLFDGLAKRADSANRLVLEISENSAMMMPDLVSVFMEELQSRGVSFALDNFGASYTAFRYLKDFYFDIVKIDGSFIQGIDADPDNQVLTHALISVAQHFDMYTIAERVETEQDAAYLRSIGIDGMQGHYFGTATMSPRWCG
nr:EAL domain-containing protein [uncultured Celeribacter sp.]